MWKKYEKVDLKSDYYKSKKTPEKSPYKSPNTSSNKQQQQASAEKVIDPNTLFQKVCCPNCRYIFKIIKNMESVRSSTPKKMPLVSQVSVQTDSVAHYSKSTQKAGVGIVRQEQPGIQSSRKSNSSIFKTSLIKQNSHNKSVMNSEVDQIKESTFQFP